MYLKMSPETVMIFGEILSPLYLICVYCSFCLYLTGTEEILEFVRKQILCLKLPELPLAAAFPMNKVGTFPCSSDPSTAPLAIPQPRGHPRAQSREHTTKLTASALKTFLLLSASLLHAMHPCITRTHQPPP